jgi:hypothetical protein
MLILKLPWLAIPAQLDTDSVSYIGVSVVYHALQCTEYHILLVQVIMIPRTTEHACFPCAVFRIEDTMNYCKQLPALNC